MQFRLLIKYSFKQIYLQIATPLSEDEGNAHLYLSRYHLRKKQYNEAEAHAHKVTECPTVSEFAGYRFSEFKNSKKKLCPKYDSKLIVLKSDLIPLHNKANKPHYGLELDFNLESVSLQKQFVCIFFSLFLSLVKKGNQFFKKFTSLEIRQKHRHFSMSQTSDQKSSCLL